MFSKLVRPSKQNLSITTLSSLPWENVNGLAQKSITPIFTKQYQCPGSQSLQEDNFSEVKIKRQGGGRPPNRKYSNHSRLAAILDIFTKFGMDIFGLLKIVLAWSITYKKIQDGGKRPFFWKCFSQYRERTDMFQTCTHTYGSAGCNYCFEMTFQNI